MKIFAAAAVLTALLAGAAKAAPVESFVEAPGPKGPLKGTMLSPGPDAPLVLVVPGSGPTDRDGNSPLGVKASTYRLLAEALAQKGVASVRIDKRGMFASAAATPNPNAVTIDAYADDVHAWAASLAKTGGRSCVWVLGHSEGALVALAAARNPENLCGLVLVSAAGRPLGAILREQLAANPANAPLLSQANAAIAALEAGRRVNTAALHPALAPLFAAPVQDFLISEMRLDPARLAAAYAGPLVIIQGDADLQVSVADAERLKAAQPSARLVVLPGVNHVLKAVPNGDRGANLAAYADPSLPLAPGLADTITAFVTTKR